MICIYDKKIKFPIVGNLNITATALALNSGVSILTGAMANEPSYSLELQFIDPNELKYIGQSIATLSGYADENYSGFLTNNKYLKIIIRICHRCSFRFWFWWSGF